MVKRSPAPAPGPDELRSSPAERRQFILAGGAFFGMIIALVVVAALTGQGSDRTSTTTTTLRPCATDDLECIDTQAAASPNIIPEPNGGRKPEGPGDRGGWEQGATFGMILLGLGVIVALAVRAARRARA